MRHVREKTADLRTVGRTANISTKMTSCRRSGIVAIRSPLICASVLCWRRSTNVVCWRTTPQIQLPDNRAVLRRAGQPSLPVSPLQRSQCLRRYSILSSAPPPLPHPPQILALPRFTGHCSSRGSIMSAVRDRYNIRMVYYWSMVAELLRWWWWWWNCLFYRALKKLELVLSTAPKTWDNTFKDSKNRKRSH